MTTLTRRDDAQLARDVERWCDHRDPGARHEVVELHRPAAGWTNETVLVTVARPDRDTAPEALVVRLPPPLPTWPRYDLRAQARVLETLAAQGVPVPRVLAYDDDEQWFGTPFLVMSREPGRAAAEVPALDGELMGSGPEFQRALHGAFVDVLAAIHRVEWHTLAGVVRGGEHRLGDDVQWWRDYLDWATDGAPPRRLADALAWCAATVPAAEPRASLCWGDARLGNVLFEGTAVASVLDWELATIGPAETDLAWYLALDDLATHFVRRSVPGFLTRAELIAHYETRLGRPVRDLAWHEIFALARSAAINDRQARLAAQSNIPYPGVAGDDNPVLAYLHDKIETFTHSEEQPS